MMTLGGRDLRTIFRAVTQGQHWRAAANILLVTRSPPEMLWRYLSGRGRYPRAIGLRTPLGLLTLTAHCHDDILTVNEIFCRIDYPADAGDRVIVDLGSNIGVSAAFFLSRGTDVFAYLFEPLARNVERLEGNLAPYPGRYTVEVCAIGDVDGPVDFGWEETGRYGGLGVRTGQTTTVQCRRAGPMIEAIVARHGAIDILKIDIERQEEAVVAQIPPALARKIRKIYIEKTFRTPPFQDTHDHVQRGPIAMFTLNN